MTIGAGDLNRRARIERLQMADDGNGGQTETWVEVLTVWARILPTGGREALEAGALTGVQGWRVTIRYRAAMDGEEGTQYRFVWNGRDLNIRSIADPDGLRTWLTAFCESGVAQ